jgi:hypothetical protein
MDPATITYRLSAKLDLLQARLIGLTSNRHTPVICR